ncbi:MAG TPA: ABC transporter permease [Bryobacteraceae bacterium]|nr:ABC transporter permease [Bryobacteraceae bacterium]
MRFENWLYTLPLRLRSLLRRKRVEQDLEDEFQFHLEQRIEDGIRRGLSCEEARADAIKALDRIQLRKDECRDTRGFNFIENALQDLRYAVRVLRKDAGFTTIAILSLALGIGANTAIFSVMDVLLLRALPVHQPAGLRLLSLTTNFGPRYSFNYPMYELIRDRSEVFSGLFAWSTSHFQTPINGDMVLIDGTYASGDYFTTLGVPPRAGRVFGREDDWKTGGKNGPVAVISEGFWSRRYGRAGTAIGQAIVLNGVSTTIIGVMPASFTGTIVGTPVDVWVPLNMQRQMEGPACITNAHCWYLLAMGRLKDGISEERAQVQLRTISRGIMLDSDPPQKADRRANFLSQVLQTEPGAAGFTRLRGKLRSPLRVLMALVGFVLLIACANMANLLTARASARHKEVVVRLAMGASRGRVIRQFVTESLLLAIAGAAGGFLAAIWATRGLIALLSTTDNPVVLDLKPDWRILGFTALTAIVAGLLFGLAPAVRATRAGIGSALKERTHQIQGAAGAFGFTRLLLGSQVALSIVLLAAAGLLAQSLVRLLTERPGFDPRGVSVISLDTTRLPEKGAALIDLYGRVVHRAAELPLVESASLLSTTPLTNRGWNDYFLIPGRTDLPEEQRLADINAVSPRLLQTMRIPLLAGRDFNEGDTPRSPLVAIVSENAARLWFPNGALGAEFGMEGNSPKLRIVGIAGNIKYMNLREETPLTVYVPYTQSNQTGFIALRTRASLRQTYANFRDLLRQVAPGAPIRTIRTMEQQIDESLSTERLTAYLSVYFAGLALLLTAVGLYGILAYSVARRISEIGIRMALGAQRSNVIWLVVREAMGHTAFGAAVGTAAVFVSAKLIASLLYGVRPHDPVAMLLAIAALAAVCAVAAWVPARRASRLEPMVALREE